jgi:hypothetical protein
MRKEEIESFAVMLQELGLSYKETAEVMSGLSRELKLTKRLWKKNNGSKLVKVGLTLIALPEPFIVTDVVGAALVTAGLLQARIKNSRLHIEDVYRTFPKIVNELEALRETFSEKGKFY